MVKICDAIMGSGKTSATIAYINKHPEKRFLYITPYLDEATRIKDGCKDADFVEPSDKLPQYNFSKSSHTLALIDEGRNISSTHQALLYYTPETIQKLKEMGYVIIIDEEVSVLQKAKKISREDMILAEDAGYIEEFAPDEYRLTDRGKTYRKGNLSHMFRLMASRGLIQMSKGENKNPDVYFWLFSKELFEEVEDVIVLTYLFGGSEMEMFLTIYDIPYEFIGIHRTPTGGYEFASKPEYVPKYVGHLKEMIHIEQSEKLNEIGKIRTALSDNWYKTHPDEVEQLRKHICNFFRNRQGGTVADRMCGTYKNHWGKIRSKGYWNSNVVFSQKSSNAYSDRSVLAYPVNLFANGNIVNYYAKHGMKFDNDRYALSIMVQWIWRSTIRNGNPISIYIPSKRMRNLLINWINTIN